MMCRKEGEWWWLQAAINDTPCVPWELHESDRLRMVEAGRARGIHPDKVLESYIERTARTFVGMYGDARYAVAEAAAHDAV